MDVGAVVVVVGARVVVGADVVVGANVVVGEDVDVVADDVVVTDSVVVAPADVVDVSRVAGVLPAHPPTNNARAKAAGTTGRMTQARFRRSLTV